MSVGRGASANRCGALGAREVSMRRRRAVASYGLLGLGLMLSFLVGCGRRAPETITIGAILPLTGDAAQWGIPPRKGAELAVKEINASGGVDGRRLKLAVQDSMCDPKNAVSAYQQLRARTRPAVVVGAVCSSATLAVAPLAERDHVALISPASTSPKITAAGDFIFRVVPTDALRAQVFAEYLWQREGLRTVALLYVNNEGGVGNARAFQERFSALGGDVVLELPYSQDATDLRAQLAQVKAARPEGVVVVSYPKDTVLVMKQRVELGVSTPFFFQTEAVEDPNVLREAGSAANGAVYILPAPAEGEAARHFAEAYRAKYGKKPELFAAEAYDIVHLIADAIRANSGRPITGELFRDYLYSVKGYPGASGTITFDEHGDVLKPMAIKRIDNGEPKLIEVVAPASQQQGEGSTPEDSRN